MGDWRYMPHSGYGRSTTDKLIGVPEKGRNAGIGLREELDRDDTGEILDILNGRGKTAAKTGEGFMDIWKDVQEYDLIELKDTGRDFPRPVLTDISISGGKIETTDKNPLESEFDRFYQGFDQMIEENYGIKKINRDFNRLSNDVAEKNGYKVAETFGDKVKWGVMNTNLDINPEKVLIPDEFKTIGKAVAENYWDNNPDYATFSEYANEENLDTSEEEQILTDSPEDVGGSYMYVSGKTAEEAGLDYESIPGFESRLGQFEVVK